ncbi:hypothetical protein DCO47_20715 [Pseudomonas sp. NDM]|nr:hypothetical protein DCO47_20715 [Pseudomonas sp. NDM]
MGASLLAKAVGQSTLSLNDPAPSRAGSLPHCLGLCAIQQTTTINVGVSLLAMAICPSLMQCLNHRYREQAHSYN